MSVKHVDIGCEPSDATARKPLQRWILPARGILGGDFLGIEVTAQPMRAARAPQGPTSNGHE
jgi:hypothetical protein